MSPGHVVDEMISIVYTFISLSRYNIYTPLPRRILSLRGYSPGTQKKFTVRQTLPNIKLALGSLLPSDSYSTLVLRIYKTFPSIGLRVWWAVFKHMSVRPLSCGEGFGPLQAC
jgi:hypothetical protein